jgi:hypothetical protein
VRRVLERLNKFLRLIHRTRPKDRAEDSRIDVAEEVLRRSEQVPVIEGELESAFPVSPEWLKGRLGKAAVARQDTAILETFLREQWEALCERYQIRKSHTGSPRRFAGVVTLAGDRPVTRDEPLAGDGARSQPFELELTSQVLGFRTLLRCSSPVGHFDLTERTTLDALYHLQYELGMVKVCAVHDVKKRTHDIAVRGERLFDCKTTQFGEIEELVMATTQAADRIEQELLGWDAQANIWLSRRRTDDVA